MALAAFWRGYAPPLEARAEAVKKQADKPAVGIKNP
jgi:hypothetical protein